MFVHYMLVRDSAWLLKCALLVLISVRDHLVHWKTKFTYFYFFHPTKAYQYFFLFLVKVVVVTREQELVLCRGDVSNLSPSRLTRMLQSLTGMPSAAFEGIVTVKTETFFFFAYVYWFIALKVYTAKTLLYTADFKTIVLKYGCWDKLSCTDWFQS